MDVSTLTLEEAEDLIRAAYLRIEQLRLDARDEQSDRTTRIEDSISALDALLGPVDAEPGIESIRAVRGFSGEVMAENASVALPLIMHGLEILTTTTRDIAMSISSKQ